MCRTPPHHGHSRTEGPYQHVPSNLSIQFVGHVFGIESSDSYSRTYLWALCGFGPSVPQCPYKIPSYGRYLDNSQRMFASRSLRVDCRHTYTTSASCIIRGKTSTESNHRDSRTHWSWPNCHT